jgi:hypothetical protein
VPAADVNAPSARGEGDAGNMTRRRRLGAAVLVVCVLVVLGFYARAAVSYGKPLAPDQPLRYGNFQNPIADAFLAHQLDLTITPPQALLHLRDPYDPRTNVQFRDNGLHDLSLYKGKLYAYFGPAPALLLYIPFRVLQIGALSPAIGTLVFVALGFLFSLALFRLLVRWCCGEIPLWMQVVAVFTLGLGVPAAWIAYVGRDYEATIACGYALLFAGVYCLARGSLTGSSPVFLALGGLALGLAVASRPSLALAGLFVAVAAVLVLRAPDSIRRRTGLLVALLAPYAAVGVLILLYNYARFGSFLEFGQSYQLSLFNPRTYPYDSIAYVPKGLYYYLLSPGRILSDFPYLFLRKNQYDPALVAQPGFNQYLNEPVAGVFTNMPVAALGFVLFVTRLRPVGRQFAKVGPTLLVLAMPALLVLLLLAYRFLGTTMRYELDFAPLLVLASLLGWIGWSRSRPGTTITRLGNALWLVALAMSVAFNLAITFTPCAGTGSC